MASSDIISSAPLPDVFLTNGGGSSVHSFTQSCVNGLRSYIGTRSLTVCNVTRGEFGASKAKEIDSGVKELETPADTSLPSIESPPGSTVTAPASLNDFSNSITARSIAQSTAFTSPARSCTSAIKEEAPSNAHSTAFTSPTRSCTSAVKEEERMSRLYYEPRSFEQAQLFHPADGVLFIGNLPSIYTDSQLADMLYQEYVHFGELAVKVSRNEYGSIKPIALLQFPSFQVATSALVNTSGLTMGGRVLRVLYSQAKRHINVVHGNGARPSAADAFAAFSFFGPIDAIWVDYYTGGMCVRFLNYGSFLVAQNTVRLDGVFFKLV